MSYAEERIYMATARLEYAKQGFRESAKKAAEDIKSATTPEEVEIIAKALLLDKRVLDEAQDNYDYIMKYYGEGVKE